MAASIHAVHLSHGGKFVHISTEILIALASLAFSAITGNTIFSAFVERLIRKISGISEAESHAKISYSERLTSLLGKLKESTAEVDTILADLAAVSSARIDAVQRLEADLKALEQKEKSLREMITALEKTPMEAAEYFAKLTSAGEKRSAKRDYFLFLAGVVVSTIIGLIMQFVFGNTASTAP